MILLLCNRENVNILILHAADDDTKRRNDGIQKRHVSTYYRGGGKNVQKASYLWVGDPSSRGKFMLRLERPSRPPLRPIDALELFMISRLECRSSKDWGFGSSLLRPPVTEAGA